jgi:hypothetical protein
MALRGEMPAQVPAWRITDAEFSDQSRIINPAPVEITRRIGIVIELLLIKSRGLSKHSRGVRLSDALRIQISHTLTEGQTAGQLDEANQVPALAAAVTVEDIFACVDIERGPGLFMQWTESNNLGSTRW